MKDIVKVQSSEKTASFYDGLMEGETHRGMLGKDTRYNPRRLMERPIVRRHFIGEIKHHLKSSDKVLDFGCGPGSFLAMSAPMCKEIVGVDISQGFVNECQRTINEMSLSNASSVHIQPDQLPFEDNTFDVIIMTDVVHHLEFPQKSLQEAFRVLKPGGRALIFEPNKLNPLIWLVHLLDKNEWGLLKLGTPAKYRKLLGEFINFKQITFNGIVLGPQSKIFEFLSDLMNNALLKPIIGWLNPKMFIVGEKKQVENKV